MEKNNDRIETVRECNDRTLTKQHALVLIVSFLFNIHFRSKVVNVRAKLEGVGAIHPEDTLTCRPRHDRQDCQYPQQGFHHQGHPPLAA